MNRADRKAEAVFHIMTKIPVPANIKPQIATAFLSFVLHPHAAAAGGGIVNVEKEKHEHEER
ncbi:MAG: hypothetical protein II719_00720 [Clostridia bacterium]|nr:hypothetical protein [Clostridia bacterium]